MRKVAIAVGAFALFRSCSCFRKWESRSHCLRPGMPEVLPRELWRSEAKTGLPKPVREKMQRGSRRSSGTQSCADVMA